MSSYVNNYLDLLKIANQEFNDTIENGDSTNFFDKLSAKNYYNYLGRYYYNKSLQNEYYNRIIVVPKNGYITQRLVYLNDSLVGGTKVGVQAINITEQDGSINLQNVGAVGFCPLGRFFDSLCYAFGIEVDKSKIDIYSLCDSVLQNFEFVYNKETGLHISINSANFNNVYVLYIVEDEKTYFDEDLVQTFANAMYNDGWFEKSLQVISDVNDIPLNTNFNYGSSFTTMNYDVFSSIIHEARKFPSYSANQQIDILDCIGEMWEVVTQYMDIESFNEYPFEMAVMPYGGTQCAINLNIYYNSDNTANFSKKQNDSYGNAYLTGSIRGISAPNNKKATIGVNARKESDGTIVAWFTGGSSSVSSSLAGINNAIIGGSSFERYTISSIGTGFVNISKDGITIIDSAKLPTGLDSLSTDYPTWFSNIKNIVGTAVSDIGDMLRNVFKIIEFVPLTLLGGKPSAEVTQDTIHTGVVLSPDYIGTLPEYTVKYLTPLPDTDTPISPDVPYVPIDDYTPSTPDSVYPWNPNPDTPIGNPTANPTNPPAIGGTTPSIPDNPIVNASNGLFTVYNPTMEQLNQFGGYLWGEDIVGILQSIFQNPIDGVISLHILYATPETGDEVPIKVGYLTSTASAKKVVKQYINIDCGTVNIPEYYGNVLDYSPFTKAHIYLPFIGIREINVNEIMGGQVNVNYKIDVLTGSVYASISVFHNAISQVLYVFEGNGSVQLPLTGGNMSRILSGVVSGIAFGALTGGAVGAVAGATGGLLKGASVSKSGSVSSNAGAMGIKYPYIMITHSQAYMANNYNTQYGYPSNLTTQLSACKGYTRVKEVHVENILVATQEEKDMIQTLLRQGVIIE